MKKVMATAALIAASQICGSALAQGFDERAGLARTALSYGSERIAIYAASDPRMPARARIEAGQLSVARGFTPSREGDGLVSSSFSWSPVLSYDPDINGGSAKSGFSFGGFDFLIPEENLRKSGVVVGASSSLNARYSYGRQTVIDMSAGSYLAYSPRHDIFKMNVEGSACATRQIERDLYVSGCVVTGAARNDLSSEGFASVRGAVNKIFDAAGYAHDVRFSISENMTKDLISGSSFSQKRAEISGQSISHDGGLFGYSAMVGEKVEGKKVRTLGLSGQMGFDSWKGKAFVGATYASFDGATWLGREVDETRYSVFLQAPVHDRIDVRIELSRTDSGSELSDGKEASFFIDVKF